MPETTRLPSIQPRNYQNNFWKAMDRGCNRAVKSWHRRGGKDITDFCYLVRQAIQRPGTYYYYFPTLELAKKALWDNLVEFYHLGECIAAGNMIDILCPPVMRDTKNNSEHFIRLKNGSIIKLGGTDNLNVVGMNGYGYVFSEWQSQKKDAFGLISPILQENGGWALFNGTMRGKNNHLYQDVMRTKNNPMWFSEWLHPEDTKQYFWINEEEDIRINPELQGELHIDTLRPYQNIQDLVDAGEISMALAKQEYINDAISMTGGTYYAYELNDMQKNNRIVSVNPHADHVYTFWDLGGIKEESDKTCILFAHVNELSGKATIVDYYENSGHVRGHYFDVLEQKGYRYGGHYFPHDAKRSNEWTGETSADTAMREFGIDVRFIPKTQSVMNDIEITRRRLRHISIQDELDGFLEQIGNYHEKESTGKPCHQNNCMECRGASHAADTLRYLSMAMHLNLIQPYLDTGSKGDDWDELLDAEDYFIV